MAALGGTFGKYFLTEKIATGGMAEIYLAKLIGPGGFEKQLVLKLIHPELSEHREFVELFVAEAKTLVSLTHGNIVPVYELGVVDGTYFLAMEYIDGPALAALEREIESARDRISPEMSAFIAAEVLKGLDYAHRKGETVIHRDISPRNVMISREGEVKLVDFGLAVTEISQQHRREASELPAGSFPYMSPEQVRQDPLDRGTDLFSAGVILWEMLTGERLFHRPTADETLEAVLKAPIPAPSQARPEIAAALDEICAKALARERGDRYRDAGEFLADLNRYLYTLRRPPSPADLAALVARRCPPVIRRAETSAGGPTAAASDPGGGTVPMARKPSGDALDGTKPMAVRGKGRSQTATFATHIALEKALTSGVKAIEEDASAAPRSTEKMEPVVLSSENAGARSWLLRIAGLVALVAGGVGLGLVLASPGAGGDAAMDAAAPSAAVRDAAMEAPSDAASADAGSAPLDAADAASPAKAGDAAAIQRPRGKGTLVVGAKPWAHVYIDGKKLGSAPGRWPIPAGRHSVELHCPAAVGEKRRVFSVQIKPGATKNLGVIDFTR